MKANAYDEAVKGADGIIHLASPVDITNTGDPQLVIQPAVKGVTGILDSVAKNGQNVKRVVQIRCVSRPDHTALGRVS